MTSTVKLDGLVASLVGSAPAGELAAVRRDLQTIVPAGSDRVVDAALEQFVDEHSAVFSGHIASQHNRQPGTSKYVDYVAGVAFNVDVAGQKAIDIEPVSADVDQELVEKLREYGRQHCPSSFAFNVVPGDRTVIQLVGQRLNADNFYTGQWQSLYTVQNGRISGTIAVDIHYFEDGNVRLRHSDSVSGSGSSAADIVRFIAGAEDKATVEIVDSFHQLNHRYFRNLRRLLPVTRAKINWGSAIGNYRLGSDVVNQ